MSPDNFPQRASVRRLAGWMLVAVAMVTSPLAMARKSDRNKPMDINAGKQVGSSRIEAVLGGCAIAEHWTSGSGPANDGRSLNQYQAGAKQWEQYWVDAQGGRLLLRGGLQGAAMVLASDDGPARQRITWTPNADGTVRQLWESSSDGGATWTVAFDGLYRRAPGK